MKRVSATDKLSILLLFARLGASIWSPERVHTGDENALAAGLFTLPKRIYCLS